MLLIPCPWCGPRDEVEFRYGGQAGTSYPADPDALSDEEWADYLFCATTRRAGSPSAGCTPPAAAAGSTSCGHGDGRDPCATGEPPA